MHALAGTGAIRFLSGICLQAPIFFLVDGCTMYNNKSAQRKKKSSLLYMQIVSLNIADKTLSARKQGLREMRGSGR